MLILLIFSNDKSASAQVLKYKAQQKSLHRIVLMMILNT